MLKYPFVPSAALRPALSSSKGQAPIKRLLANLIFAGFVLRQAQDERVFQQYVLLGLEQIAKRALDFLKAMP
jgi:hypothetical protein